jgi:hypothetical protein
MKNNDVEILKKIIGYCDDIKLLKEQINKII